FESPLFQPKGIAEVGRRCGEIFFIAVALRIDRLMTYRTALLISRPRRSPACVDEALRPLPSRSDHIHVKVVREMDIERRCRTGPFRALVKYLSRIWERMPRTVTRARIRMTYRAYRRRRPAEKLLTVAIDARGVLRIIG